MSLPLPDPVPSVWADTAGDYVPGPHLQEDISVDVAIIGGGYTGLTTAYELRRADPALDVAVFEAREIGYGSSGRNGAFAMTAVGLGFGGTALIKGKDFLARAHRYMMRAVDNLDELIDREGLDCEKSRPGFLRVATTDAYVRKVRKEVELMNGLGFDDIYYLGKEETRGRVNSLIHLAAMWEPRLLLVHPLKLVRAERDMATRHGARVFENTPVLRVRRGDPFRLETPQGTVTARKVIFATNAYSHLFPQLRRKQVPAFTYWLATEPLTPDQLAPIGWLGREGIEDARNLIHVYRLTEDNRILIGGGPVGFTFGNSLHGDEGPTAWREIAEHFRVTFPHLRHLRFTHQWGGPFSVTMDLAPAMGYLGDPRAAFSLGCIGHGVSMTHLNAQVLRDMILERDSELIDSPFVGRRVLPWPPEPLRIAMGLGLRAFLRAEDWLKERQVRRAKAQVHAAQVPAPSPHASVDI
jgi:glycine/D-amino acid oxidase-like deaminating enzyme